MSQTHIPCLLMRGGTSKGAYFLAGDLPEAGALRDRVLLAVMGSPDARQIDGIGGGNSLTSKVAIIKASRREGADVDYLFAQVAVGQPLVDYGQNCGNILAGVGPFAIERGLVEAGPVSTAVRIFMENTGQIAVVHVPTPGGEVDYSGTTQVDGVPGGSASLVIEFEGIAGSTCGALLPTGQARDIIDGVPVTCIDNGMPVVVIRAEDLGYSGYEDHQVLEANVPLKVRLEAIRIEAGPMMKLGDVSQRSVPKMCLVSAPRSGGAINTRSFIPHYCHSAIGVFAAVSVAAACLIDGTVAGPIAQLEGAGSQKVTVEHPTGEFTVEVHVEGGQIVRCGLMRTARLLFDGWVCIPRLLWKGRLLS